MLAIGLIGLYASWPLARGTSFRMGPGYLPALLSWLITAAGSGMMLAALARPASGRTDMSLRSLMLICCAIAFFGLTIEPLGIIVASTGLVVLSSLAGSQPRWREVAAVSAGLSISCAVLFVKVLGLSMKIMPW